MISWFGIIIGAVLWGIVLSGWAIVRRVPVPKVESEVERRERIRRVADQVPKIIT